MIIRPQKWICRNHKSRVRLSRDSHTSNFWALLKYFVATYVGRISTAPRSVTPRRKDKAISSMSGKDHSHSELRWFSIPSIPNLEVQLGLRCSTVAIPPISWDISIHIYIYIVIYLFMYIWIYIPHNHGSILDFNWKCTSKYLGLQLESYGPFLSYHPPIWSPSLNRPDNGHQEVSLGWHHLRHVMAPFFESGFFERWGNAIFINHHSKKTILAMSSYLTIILFHFVSYVFWQFEVEFFQPSHWPKARFVETYKLRRWSSWSWNFAVENDDHHYIIRTPSFSI